MTDTDFDLGAARAQIDDIDRTICELIDQRRAVSASIQQARMSQGESRISHSRENEVVATYSNALGKAGVAISMSVLELCRGSAR